LLVVLDTNVLIQHRQLDTPIIKTLLDEAERTGHIIHVPQVVIDETVNKYGEDLRDAVKKTENELKDVSKILDQPLTSPTTMIDLAKAEKDYREKLETTFKIANRKILEYPSASHQKVVARALKRKRPFSANGSGYRDALIWENILEILSQQETVALITNDGDFISKDGSLHHDLTKEVESGGTQAKIKVYRQLHEFVDAEIRPQLKALEDVRTLLEDPQQLKFDLKDVIGITIQDAKAGVEWDPEELYLPGEYQSPFLDMVENVSNIKIKDVRRLSSGEILARIDASVFADFDVFLTKADYILFDDDPSLTLLDYDWNEYVVRASKPVKLQGEFEVLLESDLKDYNSIEVISLEVTDESND